MLTAKNHTAIAKIANEYGYRFSGIALLKYQLEQILKLDNEKAEHVAAGNK